MSQRPIEEIESGNNGSLIYLYYKPQASMWSAYGPSAYSLRLITKYYDLESLRSFNERLKLPRTTISDDALNRLLHLPEIISSDETTETGSRMLTISISSAVPTNETDQDQESASKEIFDWDEYLLWCDRLEYEASHPELIRVDTPVSKFVPRDKYIFDGMSSFSRQLKRFVDCIASGVLLVVFSPLFLYCYFAVKREDKGPAIFRQERIGRFGRPFNILKFRTMRLDAEKSGPQLSHSGGDDDPRLTKIGRFLRSHHLDELPQLWNVFRGDMAFIGPRPERKFYIDQILEHDKRYIYLYQIRPGVTSWATLHNGYTDTMEKMLRRLEYDLYYLGHRSWIFDAKVLWQTFHSIVSGKKF